MVAGDEKVGQMVIDGMAGLNGPTNGNKAPVTVDKSAEIHKERVAQVASGVVSVLSRKSPPAERLIETALQAKIPASEIISAGLGQIALAREELDLSQRNLQDLEIRLNGQERLFVV